MTVRSVSKSLVAPFFLEIIHEDFDCRHVVDSVSQNMEKKGKSLPAEIETEIL